jgi:Fe2+ or Zn2+ uptake regulation protein
MTHDEKFAVALQSHGLSLTKPRRIVFSALQGQEPLTIQALIEHCHNIDRASIYRTVALFEKLGITQRIQTGWKYRIELSDDYHSHHHHATCLSCAKTIPLAEDAHIEKLLYLLAAEKEFTMARHQLEIQGYCQQCAAQSKTPKM